MSSGPSRQDCRLVIHGGAGLIDPEQFGPERDREYRQALSEFAQATVDRLFNGASALDAAEFAVRLLEDCPFFNAGRGSVLNANGEAEMDAAIMDGRDRRCGAVACVRRARHPVSLARRVFEDSDHVMLAGADADRFAARHDVELAEPAWFITEDRLRQLRRAARAGRVSLDHDEQYGTVGAVVRDAAGNLAAATSTGGMTNKLPGRVGDSPIIGSGTFADNATCAVSATGHGEFMIRSVVAHDVHCRMRYGGQRLVDAAQAAIDQAAALGGSGGLIAVASDGTLALPFNTPGMYRAWMEGDGRVHTAIYGDER